MLMCSQIVRKSVYELSIEPSSNNILAFPFHAQLFLISKQLSAILFCSIAPFSNLLLHAKFWFVCYLAFICVVGKKIRLRAFITASFVSIIPKFYFKAFYNQQLSSKTDNRKRVSINNWAVQQNVWALDNRTHTKTSYCCPNLISKFLLSQMTDSLWAFNISGTPLFFRFY